MGRSDCILCLATEERADQLARRQVKVTKQHNQEVRELLKLMGIPCVTVCISGWRKALAHGMSAGSLGG